MSVAKIISFVLVLFTYTHVFGSTVKQSLTRGKVGLVTIKDGYTEFQILHKSLNSHDENARMGIPNGCGTKDFVIYKPVYVPFSGDQLSSGQSNYYEMLQGIMIAAQGQLDVTVRYYYTDDCTTRPQAFEIALGWQNPDGYSY